MDIYAKSINEKKITDINKYDLTCFVQTWNKLALMVSLGVQDTFFSWSIFCIDFLNFIIL